MAGRYGDQALRCAIYLFIAAGSGSLKVALKPNRPSTSAAWRWPDEDWVKVNIDAAFDPAMSTDSAGVMIRDHDGLVLAATTRWLGTVLDVLTAEALAAREGLELAIECGLGRAVLEVDCSELKELLNQAMG
jgi:hypothetical protein